MNAHLKLTKRPSLVAVMNGRVSRIGLILKTLTLLTIAVVNTLAHSRNALVICPELNAMLKTRAYARGSIELLAVETIQDPSSGNKYLNLDVDHDGQFDDVRGSCSASLEPADGCVLSYRLTNNKKFFSHQFPPNERFFVIEYKKKIFAISSEIRQKDKNHVRHVYEFTETGLNVACK